MKKCSRCDMTRRKRNSKFVREKITSQGCGSDTVEESVHVRTVFSKREANTVNRLALTQQHTNPWSWRSHCSVRSVRAQVGNHAMMLNCSKRTWLVLSL